MKGVFYRNGSLVSCKEMEEYFAKKSVCCREMRERTKMGYYIYDYKYLN